MILHWKSLREECPLALQLIEKKTGFTYDAPYQTLTKENEGIGYHDLERFFDDHAWFMTVYPTQFPGWNGIITDSAGRHVFNDPATFANVKERNHAKSLIAGITIKYFEQQLQPMMRLGDKATVLTDDHLIESARGKQMEHILPSDLTLEGQAELEVAGTCALKRGNLAVIMKNKDSELPFIGMIITI